MRVSCISKHEELGSEKSDLILFPEYADPAEVKKTALHQPEAVVVAALKTGTRSKGYLIHQGKNRIRYLKVGSDGIATEGTGVIPALPPLYERAKICIGVLICIDVQCVQLVRTLVARMASSTSKLKIVCIPAYMGSEWFNREEVGAEFDGVHVALCNHTNQGRPRCKSFIADPGRTKICEQRDLEPLHLDIA